MKLLLDIKDNKAAFVLELLKELPYVKTKTLTPAKAGFLAELADAVEYVKLVEKGKVKARMAKDLLNEL